MHSTALLATRCLVAGARSNPGVATCLLLSVLGTAACSDSKSPGPDGATAGSGDTTGNGAGGNGQGGSGNGNGGGINEDGSAGIGLNQGGSGGAGRPPIPFEPDASRDCGDPGDVALPELKLTPFLSGFTRPILLTQPSDETERLFVVEKPGTIQIVRGGQVLPAPFLDIEEEVSERYEEMGLLGLAFHPNFAVNHSFYVYYSTLVNGDEHKSRIVEYGVSPSNPDLADVSSARVLLEIDQPQDNHNGGNLAFGSDGFLYIGLGDGGGQEDQHGANGNGQNLGTLLGKLLRIDVDGRGAGPNQAYAIPAGNMSGGGALPEIWSYGLRNPWRYSFDACTGDLYIGDVGQDAIEEVDFEPAQSGGRNYGWRLMEAEDCFNPGSGCNPSSQNLTLPVASYDHTVGQSITGGYVYRGHDIPNLRGTYLYVDYESGRFFALRMQGGTPSLQQTEITDNINPGRGVGRIGSFGEDNSGELYVLQFTGGIYRIDPE